MKIDHLSVSRIQSYQLCPYRCYKSYERREEGIDDSTDNTMFGSIIHRVAEIWHKWPHGGQEDEFIKYLLGKYTGNGQTLGPLDLYDEVWRQYNCNDYAMYILGAENIASFLERTFNRTGQTWLTEFPFHVDICGGAGIYVKGCIDRIDIIDSETIEITDYKTNMMPYTRDEMDESIQMSVYGMVMKQLHPWIKNIIYTFDFVRHGKSHTSRTEEKLNNTRGFLINMWYQISMDNNPARTLNNYCSWCTDRHDCPTHNDAITRQVLVTGENTDWHGLYEQLEDLKNRKKLIEGKIDEIVHKFKDSIAVTGQVGMLLSHEDGTQREYYLSLNQRGEYPMDSVYDILRDNNRLVLLRSLASIGKTKMDAAMKADPSLKNLLGHTLSHYFIQPSLKRKIIKQGKIVKSKGK